MTAYLEGPTERAARDPLRLARPYAILLVAGLLVAGCLLALALGSPCGP